MSPNEICVTGCRPHAPSEKGGEGGEGGETLPVPNCPLPLNALKASHLTQYAAVTDHGEQRTITLKTQEEKMMTPMHMMPSGHDATTPAEAHDSEDTGITWRYETTRPASHLQY